MGRKHVREFDNQQPARPSRSQPDFNLSESACLVLLRTIQAPPASIPPRTRPPTQNQRTDSLWLTAIERSADSRPIGSTEPIRRGGPIANTASPVCPDKIATPFVPDFRNSLTSWVCVAWVRICIYLSIPYACLCEIRMRKFRISLSAFTSPFPCK